jgi:thioredoxin-related protein
MNIMLKLILSAMLMCSSFVFAESGKMIGGQMSELPEWFKDSFLEIEEDVEEAVDSGRHVLMYMHLNGCPYCYKMINEGFKHEPNLSNIKDNFDVIAINIKGNKDIVLPGDIEISENEIGQHFKVMFTPTLVFLNGDSKQVYKMSGYRSHKNLGLVLDYVSSKSYLDSSLANYIEKQLRQETYNFRAHPNFIATRDLSQYSKEPLMVIFEDKYCDVCDKYHDELFADKDIRLLMDKFKVVRLDAESNIEIINTDGEKTTPARWVRSIGLDYRPGILLFNEGEQISKITGLLYKYHFGELLRYVGEGYHFEYPDSFYDYLRVRSGQIIEQGGIIDLSDALNSITNTK